MTEPISLIGLITSLFLPWLVGFAWVYWLLRKSGHWNISVVLGHGYLLGLFATTLVIRGWDAAGLQLSFWGIALVLGTLLAWALILIRRQDAPLNKAPVTAPLPGWQLAVLTVIAALLLYRYATMAQEIILRPLYPWDAWMNWAPKAITWFHHLSLTSFVSPGNWLSQTGDPTSYTLGARDAWKYPITVPLVELWGMLGANSSQQTVVNLPWIIVPIALGLSLYGHLRLSGVARFYALLGAYALWTMPYLNVQTLLAGYADIWVAATFGCAIFALAEWGRHRQWPYALLALLLAFMCTRLKIPGLVLGGIIVAVLASSFVALGTRTAYTLTIGTAILALCVFTVGVDVAIPGIGRFAVSNEGIALPYLGHYQLEYHAIHSAMVDTIFLMLNWNMLWYLFCLLLLVQAVRTRCLVSPSLQLRALSLALLFIFFAYYFTYRYMFALDYTQVNRALIYLVPAMVFYIFDVAGNWRQTRA
jgi:hypothetical protein